MNFDSVKDLVLNRPADKISLNPQNQIRRNKLTVYNREESKKLSNGLYEEEKAAQLGHSSLWILIFLFAMHCTYVVISCFIKLFQCLMCYLCLIMPIFRISMVLFFTIQYMVHALNW